MPVRLPKTFRHGWVTLFCLGLLAASNVGLAIGFELWGQPATALVMLGLAASLTFMSVVLTRSRVTIHEDRIIIKGAFDNNIVARQDIRGLRILEDGEGGASIRLVMKNGKPDCSFSDYGQRTEIMQTWLGEIPDLDLLNKQAREAKFLGNPAFGPTPSHRKAGLERGRREVRWLGVAGAALAAWGLFYPNPPLLCLSIIAAAPLAVALLVACQAGKWSMSADQAKGRLSLAFTPALMAGVLGWRAFSDVHFVDWTTPLLFSVGGAAAAFGIVSLADRRINIKALWLILPLCALYAWGSLAEANALVDQAPPQAFEVRVINTTYSADATDHSTKYDLTLSGWDGRNEPRVVSVSADVFLHAQHAGKACVIQHNGALEWPIYEVHACATKHR